MPIADTSPASASDFAIAPPITSRVFRQISFASCSTQPAFGVICSCSRWSTHSIRPSLSNRISRLDVVPWSIAATYSGMVLVLLDGGLRLFDHLRVGLHAARDQHVAD